MANANEIPLSVGALAHMLEGREVNDPVFQVLGVKKLTSQGSERFRILLSDGHTVTSFTMLATQLNELVFTNQLVDNTIVKIIRFALSNTSNTASKAKKIIVILEMEIIMPGIEVGGRIGNPLTEKAAGLNNEENSYPNQSTSNTFRPNPTPQSYNSQSPVAGMKRPSTQTSPGFFGKRRLNDSLSAGDNILVHPIAGLSPYQPKWTIKGKVMNKSDVRTWNNARGTGKLFSFNVFDQSGDIRFTVFTDFVDKYADLIQNGKVYYISRGNLKSANKEWNKGSHEYEVTVNQDTEIVECSDDVNSLKISYNFIKIKDIADAKVGDCVDVMGLAYQIDDVEKFTARNSGKEFTKRNVVLLDESQHTVSFTLWGSQAEEFTANDKAVIAVKKASVKEFNSGKNLSIGPSTIMEVDPDLPELHRLRGWYENECPKDVIFPSISAPQAGAGGSMGNAPIMSLEKAYNHIINSSGSNEKLIFSNRSFIVSFKTTNVFYKACAAPNCQKKVQEDGNGFYTCEKCGTQSPNFKNRMFMQMRISDGDMTLPVTINDLGEEILGKSTEDIAALIENGMKDEYDEIFPESTFKEFIFKIRLFPEYYMDEKRVKGMVLSIQKVDYRIEAKRLMEGIQKNYALRSVKNLPLNCTRGM